MEITFDELQRELWRLLIDNAPVRVPPPYGQVGKRGTNMVSYYPGYLQGNAFWPSPTGIVLNYNKVGYIGYANIFSHKPGFIEKSIEQLVGELIAAGGRII